MANNKAKELLANLYAQCDNLGAYSHHLSADACDQAFMRIRDIIFFVKGGFCDDDYEYEVADKASKHLDKLVDYAKNGESENEEN